MKRFTIKGFNNPEIAARFLELGILPGDCFEKLGRAPFKGAYRIRTEKGVFGLRKKELEAILIEEREEGSQAASLGK